jgi:hypothetical protein
MNAPGIYKGIVTNNTDPEVCNRLKALVPQVFGDDVTETDWAWPMVMPGWTSASALVAPHRTLAYYVGGGAGTSPTTDTPHTLTITANGTVPATPSPGVGVWIAFEGGDIEYPLWLGVWK